MGYECIETSTLAPLLNFTKCAHTWMKCFTPTSEIFQSPSSQYMLFYSEVPVLETLNVLQNESIAAEFCINKLTLVRFHAELLSNHAKKWYEQM